MSQMDVGWMTTAIQTLHKLYVLLGLISGIQTWQWNISIFFIMYTGFSWIFPQQPSFMVDFQLPSGNLLHSYGKSPCLMGKSTISMAIFQFAILT